MKDRIWFDTVYGAAAPILTGTVLLLALVITVIEVAR